MYEITHGGTWPDSMLLLSCELSALSQIKLGKRDSPVAIYRSVKSFKKPAMNTVCLTTKLCMDVIWHPRRIFRNHLRTVGRAVVDLDDGHSSKKGAALDELGDGSGALFMIASPYLPLARRAVEEASEMEQGRPHKTNTSGNIREKTWAAEVAPRTDGRVKKKELFPRWKLSCVQ
jgi:hypothetical protein